jgi:hypothetical protein
MQLKGKEDRGASVAKAQGNPSGKNQAPKPQKSRAEYARIGILVAIVLAAAIASSIYIDSPKGCSGVVFSVQRNACFTKAAIASGNSTMCYKISPPQLQSSCLEGVAYSTKNASVCALISDNASDYSCALNVSIMTGNESACNSLSSRTLASDCMYSFASSKDFSNVSYCSGITDSALYGSCTGSSLYLLAVKTGNPSYCSVMDSASGGIPASSLLKSLPLNESSKLSSSSITLLNMSDADICYYSVALANGEPSVCGNLPGTISSGCAYAVNSTSTRNKVLSLPSVISECNAAGVYGGNVTTDACLIGFAVSYDNVTYCSPITNSSTENACVSEVASSHANSST